MVGRELLLVQRVGLLGLLGVLPLSRRDRRLGDVAQLAELHQVQPLVSLARLAKENDGVRVEGLGGGCGWWGVYSASPLDYPYTTDDYWPKTS